MTQIFVISWNMQGFNSAHKRSLVFNYVRKYSPHICVLQETHLMGSRILSLKKAWVGYHYHTTYPTYSRGVSILVHKQLPFQLLDIRSAPGGRYIILHKLIASIPCVLVGLYLPPPVDPALLYAVMQIVIDYGVEDVLLMGDFNLTPAFDLDTLHSVSRWVPGLTELAHTFVLTDVWHHSHRLYC